MGAREEEGQAAVEHEGWRVGRAAWQEVRTRLPVPSNGPVPLSGVHRLLGHTRQDWRSCEYRSWGAGPRPAAGRGA